ncbi:MAG: GH36-type glycosyl hydrolase domain-containing protein [Oscillospiraceae bacterium]
MAAALERTKTFWQSASAWRVRTQNSAFDSWLRWVGIQPLLRRICGCSFLPHHDYGRGGRGWRDLWQDSLALLLTAPEQTRQDLLRYFAGVRTDGTNATIIGAKPGEFKADRNGIPRVWMDHGFWPMLTVELYLNETGDLDFLLEGQPYFRDTLAHRGEGKPLETPGAACEGTVLEHLLIQNVTAFYDVGEHGFMRLRGADWNGGLDMARERGESVAFTAAYAGNFTVLAKRLRDLAKTGRDGVEIPSPAIAAGNGLPGRSGKARKADGILPGNGSADGESHHLPGISGMRHGAHGAGAAGKHPQYPVGRRRR